MPQFVTRPQEAADVGSNLACNVKGVHLKRQPRLTPAVISMMLMAVAGVAHVTMAMSSECVEMDLQEESLFVAEQDEGWWSDASADSDWMDIQGNGTLKRMQPSERLGDRGGIAEQKQQNFSFVQNVSFVQDLVAQTFTYKSCSR